MKLRILCLGLCLVFILTIFGCETIPREHKGAAVGAGVGAATGAVAGAVIGDSARGTVIGGLLGALVGGAVGHYYYDQKRTREETTETYKYTATQGTMVSIEDVSATPATAKPGDVVNLKTTYAILTPAAGDKVKVTEIREINHAGEMVGQPQVTVDRTGGTYTSTVPIKLPVDAKKGIYDVKTTIRAASSSAMNKMTFTVQ